MNVVLRGLSVSELIIEAENELLQAVARHLRGGHVASADWKIEKLRKLGALTSESAEIIRKYRDAVDAGVNSEIEQAAFEALTKTEDLFEKARAAGATLFDGVLPFDADPAIEQVIQAWQRSASGKLNLAMANMIEGSGKVYVNAVNRVSLQVITGGMSPREAMTAAVKEWAQVGLPAITDKAGRNWQADTYAEMVVRSNVKRAATEVQMTRSAQWGSDLIEVSAHAGARPLCAPFQGRIFSLSGKHPKYPAFSSTSYGEPAGLFGINCGHNQYPFFEGISRQTYSPTDDMAENERIYDQSQEQRSFERTIRADKREIGIFRALGDHESVSQAAAKLKTHQAALQQFLDTTGRTRRPDRERPLTGVKLPMGPGMPNAPGSRSISRPPSSSTIADLQANLLELTKVAERAGAGKYIANGPARITVMDFASGDRGRADASGNIYLSGEVARSIENSFKSKTVDPAKDDLRGYNQAINFRTFVHEHLHLHGALWDGPRLRNANYVRMLETVNDLSAVYLAKDYAEALGLEWKVANDMDARSPGYAYQTETFERVFKAAGKSDAEIRSLVLEAKSSKSISDYDAFFKAATGRSFRWSFASMLERSELGKLYLKKFEELKPK